MEIREIIEIIALCISTIGLITTLFTAITKGKLKEFVIQKMEEVETKELTSVEKFDYVVNAVKEEYKILAILINIETFIEKVIDISKKINYKK